MIYSALFNNPFQYSNCTQIALKTCPTKSEFHSILKKLPPSGKGKKLLVTLAKKDSYLLLLDSRQGIDKRAADKKKKEALEKSAFENSDQNDKTA